ncbi:hypothetical protein HPB50_012231 [Hyalomma asiaticum]|uniref:Uncharacterized protein n=1 Tax=Hyalomma asiaticum TaxID=266040 RepID=A0ACB7TGD0_HYAAI|nr:hypothetical protein HPB50_012231 [Hyalomma asiaticum]
MIRRVSATAASADARSFAADYRSRRLHDRERAVETRRRELLTAIMALVYCCTKSCDASGRSGEHFYTILADNRYLCTYYVHKPGSREDRRGALATIHPATNTRTT